MKKSILLLFFIIFCSLFSHAQCNYKGVPGKLKRYCVSDSKPKPDAATGLSLWFDKYYFVGQVGFAKSGNEMYLYLHLARNFSKRFELRNTDRLVLTTASGNEIEVFPAGDYSGKNMMTWYAVGCYYSLSKPQLELLSKEKVERIQLYVSSENEFETTSDSGGNGWQKDEQGKVFFRHNIEAEGKKEKCRKSASCIFQKT